MLGDPGAVSAPTRDLATFVLLVAGTARPGTRTGGRAKRLSRDGTLEHGAGSGAPVEDAGIGASVRALWGGRVGELVRMREEAAVHDAATAAAAEMRERRATPAGLGSDGEESNARSNDGRSTEEESEVSTGTGAFGGMWSGRVRGKLGNWAGGSVVFFIQERSALIVAPDYHGRSITVWTLVVPPLQVPRAGRKLGLCRSLWRCRTHRRTSRSRSRNCWNPPAVARSQAG